MPRRRAPRSSRAKSRPGSQDALSVFYEVFRSLIRQCPIHEVVNERLADGIKSIVIEFLNNGFERELASGATNRISVNAAHTIGKHSETEILLIRRVCSTDE